jgi:hypothetical protein
MKMKKKYRLNFGLAFFEKSTMQKFEKLATQGWLFKRFAFGGFLLEFEQGEQQTLSYSLGFQSEPDSDYFEIVRAAGWRHVTSHFNEFHVFSASPGTAPIYTNDEGEAEKYEELNSYFGKAALYTFLAILAVTALMMLSQIYFSLLYVPLQILQYFCVATFVFCLLPYCKYTYDRLKR